MATSIEFCIKSGVISNRPSPSAIFVDPLGIISNEVGVIFLIIGIKDGIRVGRVCDDGVVCRGDQEDLMLQR